MNYSTESLDLYLKKICEIPLLSPIEEHELATRAKAGDGKAKELLIRSNLRFVVKIAKKYRNQGLSLSDLIQEGNLGLIESIDKFDETLGYRITTYCGWWIRLAIQRAIEQKGRPVKVPINKSDMLRKIKSYSGLYLRCHGREPQAEEIAKDLKLPLKKVTDALKAETLFLSLDCPMQEDLPPLSATLPDTRIEPPDRRMLKEQAAQRLDWAMEILNPREKKVLQWRFGLNGKGQEPASLRKIGAWLGLSAEGVRRIEEQALVKLRRPVILRRMEELV